MAPRLQTEEPGPRLMKSLYRYLAHPVACGYLPEQTARLEYEYVISLSVEEYAERLVKGWRRFGASLFRPRCRACSACQSMRVDVERFRPDRSQRRAASANEGSLRLEIGEPDVSAERLALYDRYHRYQAHGKGWPEHAARDSESYLASFVDNPIRTEEWRYYDGRELVGVGYVDALSVGLSGIYFFYDPERRERSLGTYNILRMISEAADRGLPHLYLGYYVGACQSLAYKGRFRPAEVLGADGTWGPFLEA